MENKTGKYFKYAIGEIILVVIGILIALQVNNWNEGRKTQKEISQTINDLEKDLIANYYLANQKLDFYSTTDSMIRNTVYNQLTAEDYEKSRIYRSLTVNWDLFTPQTDNLDKFIKSEDLISEDLKPLMTHVKLQKQQEIWLSNAWNKFDKIIDDIWQSYAVYPWFGAKDSIAIAQEIDFKLNDPIYKGKVLLYFGASQNYANNITRYHAKNLATLARIKQIRDKYKHEEMSSFLNGLGMSAFKSLDCDYAIKDLDLGRTFRSHELILNYTQDTVRIKITYNKGMRHDEILVKPLEFRYFPSWGFGITGDYNILVEQVDKNGNCIEKFGAVHNGYLLIK